MLLSQLIKEASDLLEYEGDLEVCTGKGTSTAVDQEVRPVRAVRFGQDVRASYGGRWMAVIEVG